MEFEEGYWYLVEKRSDDEIIKTLIPGANAHCLRARTTLFAWGFGSSNHGDCCGLGPFFSDRYCIVLNGILSLSACGEGI